MPIANPKARLYNPHFSNINVSLCLISFKKMKNVNEEEDVAPHDPTHRTNKRHA